MTELFCVVADKNIESALRGLLDHRRASLGVRDFEYEITVHPHRDPGCFHDGHVMLRSLLASFSTRGLLVFDQAWGGNPHRSAEETEAAVRQLLQEEGIGERSEVVVIEPELEAWVWSDSPHVNEVLCWTGTRPSLREWLRAEGLWPDDHIKPPDPKNALERVLFERRIPRSSALYRKLAKRVGLQRCRDHAFHRLCSALQGWFPAADAESG